MNTDQEGLLASQLNSSDKLQQSRSNTLHDFQIDLDTMTGCNDNNSRNNSVTNISNDNSNSNSATTTPTRDTAEFE